MALARGGRFPGTLGSWVEPVSTAASGVGYRAGRGLRAAYARLFGERRRQWFTLGGYEASEKRDLGDDPTVEGVANAFANVE